MPQIANKVLLKFTADKFTCILEFAFVKILTQLTYFPIIHCFEQILKYPCCKMNTRLINIKRYSDFFLKSIISLQCNVINWLSYLQSVIRQFHGLCVGVAGVVHIRVGRIEPCNIRILSKMKPCNIRILEKMKSCNIRILSKMKPCNIRILAKMKPCNI